MITLHRVKVWDFLCTHTHADAELPPCTLQHHFNIKQLPVEAKTVYLFN